MAQLARAVGGAHQSLQANLPVGEHRVSGHRHLAVAPQLAVEAALRRQTDARWRVVQRGQPGTGGLIVRAAFDADDALPDRGHEHVNRQGLSDARGQPQPDQSGTGQQNGVVGALVELAQSGADIAAQHLDAQVGSQVFELGLPPQAGGAHARTLRQTVKPGVTAGHERVARVFARQKAGEHQAVGLLGGNVFHGMHREVGAAVQQGLFQLFDEQALAAHFRQRPFQPLVTQRRHGQQLHREVGVRLQQQRLHVLGLPQGQR